MSLTHFMEGKYWHAGDMESAAARIFESIMLSFFLEKISCRVSFEWEGKYFL